MATSERTKQFEKSCSEELRRNKLAAKTDGEQITSIQIVNMCLSMESTCISDVENASEILGVSIPSTFSSLPISTQISFINWSRDTIKKFSDNSVIIRNLLTFMKPIVEHTSKFCDQIFQEFCACPILMLPILESNTLPYQCILDAANILHLLTYRPSEIVTKMRQEHREIYNENFIAATQNIAIQLLRQNSAVIRFPTHAKLYLTSILLSILYNLVICAPDRILSGIFLDSCYPLIFSEKRSVSLDSIDSDGNVPLPEEEPVQQNNYINRNRRRRLKRKKAQPSKLVLKTTEQSRSLTQQNFDISNKSWRSSDTSHALFLPQWMQKKNVEKNDELPTKEKSSSHLFKDDGFIRSNEQLQDDNEALTCNFNDLLKDFHAQNCTRLEAKVRQSALFVINALVASLGKHNKFAYWPQLLGPKPNLLTCILHDSHVSVRMAALYGLQTFLTDSRSTLTRATDKDESNSFTTVSRQWGLNIREIHQCLALSLLSEKSSLVLVRILKTIELLFENVNYSNLKPGLLTKVVTHVKYYLRYREFVVRANAFSVMVSFLGIKPQLEEQKNLLTKYPNPTPKSFSSRLKVKPPFPCEELPADDVEADENMDEIHDSMLSSDDFSCESSSEGDGNSLWIIQRCVDCLLMENQINHGMYVQVQLQSLKVLSALVEEHLPLMKDSISLIQHIIRKCCDVNDEGILHTTQNMPDTVQEHSYLLLSSLLNSIKKHVEDNDFSNSEIRNWLNVEQGLNICLWSLQSPLLPLIQLATRSNQHSEGKLEISTFRVLPLKSVIAASSAISHIYGQALLLVGESHLNDVFNVTRYLLNHKEYELRLCGLEIVGLLVGYEAMQQSLTATQLVRVTLNVANEVLICKESNAKKDRLLAAWTLANISAVLDKYREAWSSSSREPFFSEQVVTKYLDSCITGSEDKDKIRTHIVRFVGNLIAFMPTSLINIHNIRKKIDDIVLILIESSTTGNRMKMRWNACHALANIVSNENIVLEECSWQSLLITSFSKLVENFRNFKVRMLACTTLCCIRTREAYGNDFISVWKAFFKCIENTDGIVGQEQLQHRENLICQILIGLCHLIELMTLEDLLHIGNLVIQMENDMKVVIEKYSRMIPPDKTSCFIIASDSINALQSHDALTPFQCKLCAIFNSWLQVA